VSGYPPDTEEDGEFGTGGVLDSRVERFGRGLGAQKIPGCPRRCPVPWARGVQLDSIGFLNTCE